MRARRSLNSMMAPRSERSVLNPPHLNLRTPILDVLRIPSCMETSARHPIKRHVSSASSTLKSPSPSQVPNSACTVVPGAQDLSNDFGQCTRGQNPNPTSCPSRSGKQLPDEASDHVIYVHQIDELSALGDFGWHTSKNDRRVYGITFQRLRWPINHEWSATVIDSPNTC